LPHAVGEFVRRKLGSGRSAGRTRAYSLLRIGGALFATLASVGWIVERLLDVQNAIDPLVQIAAHHAAWIAAALFLISLLSWLLRRHPTGSRTAAEELTQSIPEPIRLYRFHFAPRHLSLSSTRRA
jgi:hypothetical protein